jgi:hypothetical protein
MPSLHVLSGIQGVATVDQLEALAAQPDTDVLRNAMASIAAMADAGWSVGDGSMHDPCVDLHPPRSVGVAFCLFGAALLLVVADGCLLHLRNTDVLGLLFGRRRYGWWTMAWAAAAPPPFVTALLAAWFCLSCVGIALDVAVDTIVVIQLLPLVEG